MPGETRKPPCFYYLRRILLATGLSVIAQILWFNELFTFTVFLMTSLCFDWYIFNTLGRKESMLISEPDLLKISGSTHENLDAYAAFCVSARRRSAPWALCLGWAFYCLIPQPHVAGLVILLPYLVILIPQIFYLQLQMKITFPYPTSKEPTYQLPHVTDPNPINFVNPASPYYRKSMFDS